MDRKSGGKGNKKHGRKKKNLHSKDIQVQEDGRKIS